MYGFCRDDIITYTGLEDILDMHCFAKAQIFGAPLENAQNQTFLNFKFRTWFHVDIRINFGTLLHVVTAWGNTAVLGGLAFDNLLSLVIYWLVNYPVLINHQLDQVKMCQGLIYSNYFRHMVCECCLMLLRQTEAVAGSYSAKKGFSETFIKFKEKYI